MAQRRASAADPWARLLPRDNVTQVVQHLVQTWRLLAQRPFMDFSKPEPYFTKALCKWCQRTRTSVPLTGDFLAEAVDFEMDDDTGDLSKERRSDIEYRCQQTRLSLIFEFKRLRKKSDRDDYCGRSGVMKFVDGRYSADGDVGCMVAIIAAGDHKAYLGLRRALSAAESMNFTRLKRQSGGHGQAFIEPSSLLPQLAEFDTQHHRQDLARTGIIQLAHLRLEVRSAKTSSLKSEALDEP